jgi:hypothetical protein
MVYSFRIGGDIDMLRMMLKVVFCLLASMPVAATCIIAQGSVRASQKVGLAQMPLENVRIEVQSIEEIFLFRPSENDS